MPLVRPPAAASDVHLQTTDANGVAAEWSLAQGSDPSKVLLFLHGGGYCSGSIASHRGMVTAVGRAAGVRTLAAGYRLAPEHPFPAAVDDARAAFDFLLDQGIAPDRIAVGGDSAGGGLTLSLITSLREAGKPLPGCAWLVSPWVDLQMTGMSMAEKAGVDPLIQKPYLEELASAYSAGFDPANPRVSPLHADLSGLPPLLVQVGSAETLLDDALRIARKAAVADVPVKLEVWPHMIHAWHLWVVSCRTLAARSPRPAPSFARDCKAAIPRPAAHSPLTPAILAIACHFGISLATKAARSSGVPGRASAASCFKRVCIGAELSPALIAALSLPTMSLGVPAGAMMLVHELAMKSGKPLSIMVGTSGRSGRRVCGGGGKRPDLLVLQMAEQHRGGFEPGLDLPAEHVGEHRRGTLVGNDHDVGSGERLEPRRQHVWWRRVGNSEAQCPGMGFRVGD